MAPNTNTLKKGLATRAESAPPTRGREGFDISMSIPKAPVAPATKPPIIPVRPDGAKPHIPSGALKRPKRMLPRDPMASRCSLAMSRTESVLVSSSGDVMVCRCRRSSTPFLGRAGNGYYSDMALMDPWTNLIPCCDAPDCIVEGPWSPVFDSLTVQKKISSESSNSEGSTYEWEKINTSRPMIPPKLKKTTKTTGSTSSTSSSKASKNSTKSLPARPLSSAPPEANSPERTGTTTPSSPLTNDYQTPTVETMMEFNAYDGGILPLPSFDYDHIHQGFNDMVNDETDQGGFTFLNPPRSLPLTPVATPGSSRRKKQPAFATILESPEEKKDEAMTPHRQSGYAPQPFYHGIPVFLTTLSQIRIQKVSAHPLGAHVLLISDEALLFSYGLNNHGQLGIGIQSSVTDAHRGFHVTPTLITPLLENGGKTIHCAAGVDHSLVVVATEGRRLHKLPTRPGVAYSDYGATMLVGSGGDDGSGNVSPSSSSEDQDSVRHHQLYGFGSNDFMKIGLVSARLADDGAEGDGEDILLPRRVALHCNVWPNKGDDSVDADVTRPHQGIFDIAASAEHSAALVQRATGDIEVYMWGNATLGALGLPVVQDPEVKIRGGLTQRPTSNANNIFPLPTVLEALTYRPHRHSPLGFPRQLALGPYCSFVVMSTGRCMSFGFSAEGMLGHGYSLKHTMDAKEVFFPPAEMKGDGIVSVSAGAYHAIATTRNGHAYSWGINSDDRLGHGTLDFGKITNGEVVAKENLLVIEWVPQPIDMSASSRSNHKDGDSVYCIDACAGYDSSMLVARSGQVYCFGKRSGRLGKGEVAKDVSVPLPLHGGLRLFHNSKRHPVRPHVDISRARAKPLLKRMLSDGAVMNMVEK